MKALVYSRQEIEFWKFPAWLLEELRRKFPEITFEVNYGDLPLKDIIEDVDILITSRLTPEEFKRARNLKWIHSPFVGIGNMLFEELVSSPVFLTNSRGVNREAVSTHAVGLALALMRGIPWSFHFKAKRKYHHRFFTTQFIPLEPSELKAGIMGYGEIGSSIGEKMKNLGFEVLCLTRSGSGNCFSFKEIDEFLRKIDILIIAAPRTKENEGIINYQRMKTLGGFLINVGRGKIVVESDLITALRDGTLKGAALDVFEREPLPPESPLWEIPNLIITPHISGTSRLFWEREKLLLEENLELFLKGLPLKNLVNKKLGY